MTQKPRASHVEVDPTGLTYVTQADVQGAVEDLDAALAAAGGYTDEQARDAIGAALVQGTGVTIGVNDAGDTITISATGGAATAFVNRALGKTYTLSPSPHASYPDAASDQLFLGSGYTGNKLTDGNYGGSYTSGENVGWDAPSADPVIRIDLGSATSIDRAVARGRFGTGGVYRPVSFKVEHSDNDSTWTQDFSVTGLSNGGQPGDRNWMGVMEFSGSSHRYWRVTLGRAAPGFIFVNEVELWG